jgi:hypothetical protein
LEFAFETKNGIPISPTQKEYKGGIRAIGKIGETTIVEPLPYYVYYTPFNGWLIVALVIVIVVISLLIILFKYKKKRII